MSTLPEVNQILAAVRSSLTTVDGPLVLAVSGGGDSMVLLRAVHRVAPERLAAVATFDHGTGSASRQAVELVAAEGGRLNVQVVVGVAPGVRASEAAWRDSRWAFLRQTARLHGASVATAHTRDDHIETVLMRVLRGSGARGLSGLYADSDVVRPFLGLDRSAIRAVADAWDVRYVEDPTNASPRFLRNRVRRDLLPALRAVRPDFDSALLQLSLRASDVRRGLDAVAGEMSEVLQDGGMAVATAGVGGYSRESLQALWPALAARAGVILDRRGTERAASFTINSRVGGRVQVSGGWELVRGRDRFELRRPSWEGNPAQALGGEGSVQWGSWRFSRGEAHSDDVWAAVLPREGSLIVRTWQPGDRMVAVGTTQARRVKRFLSDAQISGPARSRWPVVVSNGVIVWIPGVRRSDAATARPGRSELPYECEFDASR